MRAQNEVTMSEGLVKYEGQEYPIDTPENFQKMLRILRCHPERWAELLGCPDKVNTMSRRVEERCKTLEGQCEVLMRLVKRACCSANVNFSQITIDEYSDDSQVNLDQIVKGLGGQFVDAFPVAPNGVIRLQHPSRPGWTPTQIRIDMNLAGNANNYLDFYIAFYLGPGDGSPHEAGKKIGPTYRGNQFLNKDGGQIIVPFPKYKGVPIDVGSLERLVVEISNRSGGGTNLESAQVVILYDNNKFFEMCRVDICKPDCGGACGGGGGPIPQ